MSQEATPDSREDALRASFAHVRQQRTAETVPFASTLAGVQKRSRRTSAGVRDRLVFAWAIAVAVVIAIGLHARAQAAMRADIELAREIGDLVTWRSPTAALLATDYRHNLQQLPTLTESFITAPTSPAGGTR